MSDFVISAPERPFVPVAGGGRFPVRRIFCVGRNYADHAREMGHDPGDPFFFGKPADAVLTGDADMPYPPATRDLHFEAELVVALSGGGRDIAPGDASALIWGHAAGIDFTRRDLQAEAKEKGRPWDMAKGFDHSAACGMLHPVAEAGLLEAGFIRLSVDGAVRQQGDLAQMILPVPQIIAHLSRLVALAPGDLIYTGTPAGVAACNKGQTLLAEIEGLTPLTTRIV
ncbi:fumarylacetoacetate hydrolase family protein [Paracoccus bogoriensis]|uniref:fumarylacetoacetate hydrolase family protein n=1 Tax=Paracoccus bogoriensis TaxID=242065 RepID=UPI001C678B08|nr:fumarylacetoacetate hydrolase family protein [Paracoccus bogoriensis]MBW7057897.1 fumarylacetoacetate hydrolase family protein [Paracoccus bogoriensis]